MQKYDIAIVGGGIVGLTAALAICAKTRLQVAVIEPQPVAEETDAPNLRVSAINAASQQLFAELGIWQEILQQRLQAYQQMHVWDKDGPGLLNFADDGSADDLGWIIENDVIRRALYQQVQQNSRIDIINQPLSNIAVGDSEVFLSFSEHSPLLAKLLIAADGGNSWVRQQLKLPMTFRDYDHHALVATVNVENHHDNTAWQVFLDSGPLALLPLYHPSLCSIVWSAAPDKVSVLKQLSTVDFNKAITSATDGKLGLVTLQSERLSFPLKMQLVDNFVQQKVILIGDAAHTIHPLAGQGVNLGLQDAVALADTLAQVFQMQEPEQVFSQSQKLSLLNKKLGEFSRFRKAEATEMIVAMEAIKQGFAIQQKLPKLLRGLGMRTLNNLPLLKQQLVKKAMGK
ncbi:UbiH/UbiF/VisC/COQ6 family ubiquinone biosynthesis hydroxylase [Thalassotalea mangrovi]|uniref:FAD-dependent oxidoreductase n=1 Tax=Thalassotalea mangrovi TaxID=2572245 RepID=A0A4U1BAC4_9GAMM|nr:UbiH/UbiF/VisC/COQ6 family ubiquinone biosynthesis hydroxylase [Thalassotalea mangrovi]TKB47713.1 FAD-dependent oxidoreductase [Thalassotalea mangrovi]